MDNMDKYLGKMLDDRYEIMEVIGVGGMAVVYKAMCHRLNRYVAIKDTAGTSSPRTRSSASASRPRRRLWPCSRTRTSSPCTT